MILELKSNQYIDGSNVRKRIVSDEMALVSNIDLYRNQERRGVSRLRDFKSMIESEDLTSEEIINRLTTQSINVDILSGLSKTCPETFGYIEELKAKDVPMPEERFNLAYKTLTDLNSLYNSMTLFKSQFYSGKVNSGKFNRIDVDESYTDSDGKALNVVSSLAVDDSNDIVDVSDTTLKNNFKIYLTFLYTAICSIKGSRYDSDIADYAFNVLGFLWFEDTRRSILYEINGDKSLRSYTDNKRIIPMKKGSDGLPLKPVSHKKDFIEPGSMDEILTCIGVACQKVYAQYKDQLGGEVDKIDVDCFVFARYIYRMFNILDVHVFEPNKEYTQVEATLAIIGDGTSSIKSRIPGYKFLPSFYNSVKTLKEWYTLTKEDVEDEYKLQKYAQSDTHIRPPQYNVLNSSAVYTYPRFTQSRTGSKLDRAKEYRETLELAHLNKLFCTAAGSDLFKHIFDKKMERIISLEPVPTISTLKTNGEYTCTSLQIEKEMNRGPIQNIISMYRMTAATNLQEYSMDNIEVTDAINLPTDPIVEKAIRLKIDDRIDDIAEIYLSYYYNNHWDIPELTNKQHLVEQIRQALKWNIVDSIPLYYLLGDCLILDINKASKENGRYVVSSDTRPCAVTEGFKLVCGNRVRNPILVEREKEITEGEYLRLKKKFGETDIGLRKTQNGQFIQVEEVVCISDDHDMVSMDV